MLVNFRIFYAIFLRCRHRPGQGDMSTTVFKAEQWGLLFFEVTFKFFSPYDFTTYFQKLWSLIKLRKQFAQLHPKTVKGQVGLVSKFHQRHLLSRVTIFICLALKK